MKKALTFLVLLLIILSLVVTACSSSEKNIIGTVDEVAHIKVALSKQPLTLLTITDEDGNKHYVGVDEYTDMFKEGQRIKIYYKKEPNFKIGYNRYIESVVQKDGSIKYESGDRWWHMMLEYEILP